MKRHWEQFAFGNLWRWRVRVGRLGITRIRFLQADNTPKAGELDLDGMQNWRTSTGTKFWEKMILRTETSSKGKML